MRSISILAATTRQPVLMRSIPTQLAPGIRPPVRVRSIAIQPVSTTRPTERKRSIATPPATTTLQWAFRRVSTSPRAITIFISAIPGITVSTIRSASAPPEFRRPHSLPGISGVTVPAGVGVIVGTDGKLGTVVSSERFKDAIKPMDNEAILALKPITFQYKKDLDPVGIPQCGLVSEQVEKVNPELVAC